MEYIDVLKEDGTLSGKSLSHWEVHEKGLLHRSVHVWVHNPEKGLLLQRRGRDKKNFPDMWDVSVGGHISAGQTSIETAVRETEEEIGLSLPPEAFERLFERRSLYRLNGGTFIENELNDVYLVRTTLSEDAYVVPPDEVEYVRYVPVPEFKEWVSLKRADLCPHWDEYEKLFARLAH